MDIDVTFRIDSETKAQMEDICNQLGMTTSDAFKIFLPRRLSVQRGYHSRLIFAHRLRQFRESKHWLMSGRPSVTLTRTTRGCRNNFFVCYRVKGTLGVGLYRCKVRRFSVVCISTTV